MKSAFYSLVLFLHILLITTALTLELSNIFRATETPEESFVKLEPKFFDASARLGPSSQAIPSTTSLPYPNYLKIFTAQSIDDTEETTATNSLKNWGRAAKLLIDEDLSNSGAILLRNLKFIKTAAEFKIFWEACRSSGLPWEEADYVSFGGNRVKDSGIDLATNIPPQNMLCCHNEMAYNPRPAGRIALFCLQDAEEGGESLLARNSDLTKCISDEIKAFTKAHGGVLYSRKYHDASRIPMILSPMGKSWQDKCLVQSLGEEGRCEAKSFFRDLDFLDEDMTFDEDGNFTVRNIHPGFIVNESGEEVWFNIVDTGGFLAGDSTPFPKELLDEVKNDRWKATQAFKLKPGDWLICDNLKVQHGRLPYKDSKENPRKLLTVYTK